MNTTTTNLVKVYNCKTQEQAEDDACLATAEDWMYGEGYLLGVNTKYQYYVDPVTDQNVMLEITVDTISMFQITQIDLIKGDIRIYNVEEN